MSSFNRTAERARNTFIVGIGIPPTAVGGWLKPSLHKRKFFSNPPNGSWGMVKVRPSGCGRRLLTKSGRLNLNHPRTAVGGIQKSGLRCRSDFNHPPTAVGGIEEQSSEWTKSGPRVPRSLLPDDLYASLRLLPPGHAGSAEI